MGRPRILIVDDERDILELLEDALTPDGYEVVAAEGAPAALAAIRGQLVDAAIVDLRLPGISGLELLRELRRLDPSLEVIMTTGYPELRTAIDALKQGASDYLQKPLNLDELRHSLGQAVERRFLRREVTSLRSRLGERSPDRPLIGASPAMSAIRELVARVATTDSPVLIEGESGTGKELVAEAVHRLSARRAGPFIAVNCGAVPPELLESEFFGHVRGAFSGAVADTLGLFRSAHGGTLFLDEVAELPVGLQVKLLRVLQEREVRPVGSSKTFAADVRIVAATNQRLDDAVREGRLRQDLFYRLNVIRILVPPLRERREDVPALVAHFLRQLNDRLGRDVRQVAAPAMAALEAYDFPGNVRELENLLERAYALGATRTITLADLPSLVPPLDAGRDAPVLPTVAAAERDLILRALRQHGNNKERAARALGLSSRTLYRRLKEYGIQ